MPRHTAYVLATFALCTASCGTTRSYTMPLASDQVPQAVDPLLVCATRMNLQAKQKGSSVVVHIDDDTCVLYKASDSGTLVMETHVRGSEDEAGTADKLAAAKSMGDALFKCAQEVPTPASKAPGAPTPTMGNTTSPKGPS